MHRDEANRLLDRIGRIAHPCDLDLLMFFARHPRTLVTSEQLATWLGYELRQIAPSLEVLLESGWLTRSQSPAHAARNVRARHGRRQQWMAPFAADGRVHSGRTLGHAGSPGHSRPERWMASNSCAS